MSAEQAIVEIVLELDPDGADRETVLRGLMAFNEKAGGPSGFQPMAILLKDDAGATVGGLTGRAVYDWLFIELLHIPEPLRGQDYGTRLMQKAEAFARERGLTGIWLDTFAFQAPGFYEKLGFTVFGAIEDHPAGGRRYFLQKRLDGVTA